MADPVGRSMRTSPWRWPETWIGAGTLLALGTLAWRFYLERMATNDSAWISFLVIDQRMPQSVLERYGSWLAQLLPVALIHLGAGLQTVIRSYSLSIVLIQAVLFWLLAFRFRDRAGVVALALVIATGFYHTWYLGISEVYQALALSVLLWLFVRRTLDADAPKAVWVWGIATTLLNVLISLFHQLPVMLMLFLLGWEGIGRKALLTWRFWALAALLVIWYAIRIRWLSGTNYEQDRMPTMAELREHGRWVLHLRSTKYLQAHWQHFTALLLLAVTAIATLLARGQWLKLTWAACIVGLYLILILVTDQHGLSPMNYENYVPLLAFFAALPFAEWAVKAGGARIAFVRHGSLILLIALGIAQIRRGHHPITAKVRHAQRMTDFLRAQDVHKAIGDKRNFPWLYAWGGWPQAAETSIISALSGPITAVTVFAADDIQRFDSVMHEPTSFLGPDWSPFWFTSDHMDSSYFIFPATGYTVVNSMMPDSIERGFGPGNILIEPSDTLVQLWPDELTVTEIRITNRSSNTLGSLREDGVPIRLVYRLYGADGRDIVPRNVRTELEIDIPAGMAYTHALVIERPPAPARYKVVVGIIGAGDRDLGATGSFWIDAR